MKNSLSSINTYQSKYEKRNRKQKPAAALSGTANSFSAGSGGAVLFSGNCSPAFARQGWRFDPRKACVAAARQAGCPVSCLQAGLPCASCARETGFTLISRGRAEFGRRFTEIVTRAKEDGKDGTKWFRAREKTVRQRKSNPAIVPAPL